MDAKPTRVIEYFDGNRQCMIPLFQRPYSWTKKEWGQLWEDVMTCYDARLRGASDSSSQHFLGAVVSVPTRTVPVGVTKSVIIDGQQRLTTLSLLIAVLRDVAAERTKDRLYDYLFNRHEDGLDRFKLLPTQTDRAAYSAIIEQREHLADHPMSNAYRFFLRRLKDARDIDDQSIDHTKLFEAIQQSLWVVYINLAESDDPYLIFESLNAKGLPLTPADLIRNYILMRFRSGVEENNKQQQIFSEVWEPMSQAVGDAGSGRALTDFFRYYECTMLGEAVTDRNLYASLKERLVRLGEAELETEVRRMSRYAKYYQVIQRPELETDRAVAEQLSTLKKLEINVQQPLVLRLLEARDAGRMGSPDLAVTLAAITSLLVRRSIQNEGITGLNKRFPRIAKALGNVEIATSVISELDRGSRSEGWPTDEQFLAALQQQEVYNRRGGLLLVLLEGLERELAGKEFSVAPDTTIEHVMPQTLSEAWKVALGPDYERVHTQWLDRLANLTLTGYNSELSNAPFSQKRQTYADSSFRLNADIALCDRWTEAELQQRAIRLAEVAVRAWPHANEFRRRVAR